MNSFDHSFWKDVLTKSSNLTKPVLIKNQLTDDLREDLFSMCNKVFKKIINKKEDHTGTLRVWLDGEPQHNHVDFWETSFDDESVLEWSKRNYGKKKFGVILNFSNNHNIKLKKELADIIYPLLDLSGIPYRGINATIFFGNYGYTPLGFHQDPPGHKVFHLHLGPDDKKMYLIPPEKYENEYKEITNASNGCTNFEYLIPKSTEYHIETGDFFFMPSGEYHVGYNNDYSLALTLWHVDPCTDEFKKLVSRDIKNLMDIGKKSIVPVGTDKNNADEIERLASLYLSNHSTLSHDMTFGEILKDRIQMHKSILKSNAFMEVGPYSLQHDIPNGISLKSIIQSEPPFKILYLKAIDNSYLLAHGLKVIVPEANYSSTLNKLNSYEKVSIDVAFEELLESFESDLILHIVKELIKTGAITLEN